MAISRSKVATWIEYLFALILMLQCRTIWCSTEDSSLGKILKVALVGVVALYVLLWHKFKWNNFGYILLFGGGIVVYFLLYYVANGVKAQSFLLLLVCVFCLYAFIVFARENHRLMSIFFSYENIIVIVAAVSLVFWVFGSLLGVIHPTGSVYQNWSHHNATVYYGIYYEVQYYDDLARNTAIFTEAPMCSFQFCLAFLVELFCREKMSKVRTIILLLGIITTFSTTGWCLIVIAVFLRFMFSKSHTSFLTGLKYAAVPILLIAAIIVLQTLVLDKLDTGSGSTRMDDFAAGFKAWMTHPFFGAGYGNGDYTKQFMSSFRSGNQGFSNSPMNILATGGIFFGIPYIGWIVMWARNCIKYKNIKWFLFIACFLFMFTITIVSFQFLTFFVFMASSVMQKEVKVESLDHSRNLQSGEVPATVH